VPRYLVVTADDVRVLQSEDCNGSGLESEQPGPQPCQQKLLSCNGCATWFQNQWGNSGLLRVDLSISCRFKLHDVTGRVVWGTACSC
jgi:hypothetical protein